MDVLLSMKHIEGLTSLEKLYQALNMPFISLVGKGMSVLLHPFESSRIAKQVDDYYDRFIMGTNSTTIDNCFCLTLSASNQPLHNPVTGEHFYQIRFTKDEVNVFQSLLDGTYQVATSIFNALEPHANKLSDNLARMKESMVKVIRDYDMEALIRVTFEPEVDDWVQTFQKSRNFILAYPNIKTCLSDAIASEGNPSGGVSHALHTVWQTY